jgi:hypothetical protein
MDPVTRVRQLSALYRNYATMIFYQPFDYEKMASFWAPDFNHTLIWQEYQCCPTDQVSIIVVARKYQCYDAGAKLLSDGTVMIKSTCIYDTNTPALYGLNFTQYWIPAPGICNYKLKREITFDLRCANFNATCGA